MRVVWAEKEGFLGGILLNYFLNEDFDDEVLEYLGDRLFFFFSCAYFLSHRKQLGLLFYLLLLFLGTFIFKIMFYRAVSRYKLLILIILPNTVDHHSDFFACNLDGIEHFSCAFYVNTITTFNSHWI